MIIQMLIMILFLVFLSLFIFKKDLLSPSFLLCFPFFLATLCCCYNNAIWEFRDYKLLYVVFGGLLSFMLGCGIISLLNLKNNNNVNDVPKKKIVKIKVSSMKLLTYLLFELILFFLEINYIKNALNYSGSLLKMIGIFYEMNKIQTIAFKGIINVLNIFNFSGIYIIIYIIANNIVAKEKNNYLLYIVLFIGCFISLLTGSRTTIFMYILSFVICFFGLKNISNGWKDNLNIKILVKLSCSFIALIYLFYFFAEITGRSVDDMTFIYNVSTYLGAPLKNLELFLIENKINSPIFGSATFFYTYMWFADKALLSLPILNLNLFKYRWINNHGLGNVYTLFMPLFNDFGFFGVFVIMFMLGMFFQKIYYNLKYKGKYKNINYKLIIYSYFSFALIFSFFSNKIFECIFSISLVYFLIGLYLFDIYFFKLQKDKYGNIVLKLKRSEDNHETSEYNCSYL